MNRAVPTTTLCSRDLRALRHAGAELLEVMQALQRKGRNVVTELLPDGRSMTEWDHYPADDAFDADSGCRWYYHTHPDAQRGAEHGHFHVFARAPAAGYTHLVALSVSAAGMPLRAFTTNRWVTNEVHAPAGRVLRRLQQFSLRQPAALTLVNRWLAAVIGLFRPQLAALLEVRDRRVDAALATRPNLFEDRRTMLLSQCRLDLQQQLEWLDEVGCKVAKPARALDLDHDAVARSRRPRVRGSIALTGAPPTANNAGEPLRGTLGPRFMQAARPPAESGARSQASRITGDVR